MRRFAAVFGFLFLLAPIAYIAVFSFGPAMTEEARSITSATTKVEMMTKNRDGVVIYRGIASAPSSSFTTPAGAVTVGPSVRAVSQNVSLGCDTISAVCRSKPALRLL